MLKDHNNLNEVRCFVFDFDGTLKLTNQIKRQGFFEIIDSQAVYRAQMETVLESCDGDRYEILKSYAAIAGGDLDELVSSYSSWCERQIIKSPEREGASSVLRALKERQKLIYVNSATPQNVIKNLIPRIYGTNFFDGIYGGSDCKSTNLLEIMTDRKLVPNDVVMIGDGLDDWVAAQSVGCKFRGVAGGSLQHSKKIGPSCLIDNLKELL